MRASSSSLRCSWLGGLQNLRASVSGAVPMRESIAQLVTADCNSENRSPDRERLLSRDVDASSARPLARARAPLAPLAHSTSSSLTDCSSISGHADARMSLLELQGSRTSLPPTSAAPVDKQLWIRHSAVVEPFCYTTPNGELVILTEERDVFFAVPMQSSSGSQTYARFFLDHANPLELRLGSCNGRMKEEITALLERAASSNGSFFHVQFSSRTTYIIDAANDHNTSRLWQHRHHLSSLRAAVDTVYARICTILRAMKSRAPQTVLYFKRSTVQNLLLNEKVSQRSDRGTSDNFDCDSDSDSDGSSNEGDACDNVEASSVFSAGDSRDTNDSKRIPLSEAEVVNSCSSVHDDSTAHETHMSLSTTTTHTTTGISSDDGSNVNASCTGLRTRTSPKTTSNANATPGPESIDMKCTLMANEPLPDMTIQWVDGTYLAYNLDSGAVKVECPKGCPARDSVPAMNACLEEVLLEQSALCSEKSAYAADDAHAAVAALEDLSSWTDAPLDLTVDSVALDPYEALVSSAAQYNGIVSLGTDAAGVPIRFKGYLQVAQAAIRKVFEVRSKGTTFAQGSDSRADLFVNVM